MGHIKKILKFLILATTITFKAKSQLNLEAHEEKFLGLPKVNYFKIKHYLIDGLKTSFKPSKKETYPAFADGSKISLWPEKSGSIKFEGPDWLQYLGIYLDLSFNPLRHHRNIIPEKTHYTENADTYKSSHTINSKINLSSKRPSENMAFVLALRANYLKTKKLPTGRLQPYIGIGPSLLFADQKIKFKFTVAPRTNDKNSSILLKNLHKNKPKNRSSKSGIGLSLNTGLRQMLSPNFSLDYSLKYRVSSLSFSFDSDDSSPTKNHSSLFNLKLELAYHF